MSGEPTGLDLEAVRRRLRQREGAYHASSYLDPARPIHLHTADHRCANDVPALLDEVERLRTLAAALVAEDGPGSLAGFVKHNGAGEIVFRQACHPSNHPGEPWVPVFYGTSEIGASHVPD